MDLKVMVESIGLSIGNTSAKIPQDLSPEIFKEYLNSIKLKNGFTSAVFEFAVLNEQLAKMKLMSNELIRIIEREIKRG